MRIPNFHGALHETAQTALTLYCRIRIGVSEPRDPRSLQIVAVRCNQPPFAAPSTG